MNRNYRLIFKSLLNTMRVASETACFRGKCKTRVFYRTSVLAGTALALTTLIVNPAMAQGGKGGGSGGGAGGGVDHNYQGLPGQNATQSAWGGGGGGPGASGGAGNPAVPGVGGVGGSTPGAAGGDANSTGTAFAGAGGGGGGAHGYTGTTPGATSFTGGHGGAGGDALEGDGGGGGAGGYGAVVTGAGTDSVPAGINLTGGTGGTGGFSGRYNAGHGGAGGAGMAYVGSSLSVSGRLAGGQGGAGGDVGSQSPYSSSRGGEGGAGLIIRADSVTNTGEIIGGNGGTGGDSTYGNRADGAGGIGIRADDDSLVIRNTGLISGGLGADGHTRADAIRFAGGTNQLELIAGGTIIGNVDATSGSDDTLVLGGDINGHFDASTLGDAGQYRGFETLEKTGQSIWRLTGASSYTGATIVKDGELQVAHTGALGSGPVIVNAVNGRLVFEGPDVSATELEIVIEHGRLHFTDGASAANAQIINKEVFDNVLFSGNSDAGTASIENHGGIYFSDTSNARNSTIRNTDYLLFRDTSHAGHAHIDNIRFVEFMDNASGNNAVIANAGGAWIDISRHNGNLSVGSISGEGDIYLGRNTLMLGERGHNDSIGGVIQDGGRNGGTGGALTKIGTGTLTLTGANTYTGNTTVDNGTLLVNGTSASSSHIVNSGATLGGTGTVGSTTINAGGILAPGNSIGTLTVNGHLTFESGSRFEVEVNPRNNDSDRVEVTGDVTLNGGAVAHVGAHGGYNPRSSYTILTAGGTLTGAFDEVTSDFAFLTPHLLYDYNAGTIDLELSRNQREFAGAALTRNQIAVAQGIETIGLAAGHAVYDAVVQLPDDDRLIRRGFDALSGEIHASLKTALIEDSRFIRHAATERVRAAYSAPDVSSASVATTNAVHTPPAATAERHAPVVWSQAFGSWGKTDSNGNAASLNRNTGGVLMGADRSVGDWRLGILAGYSYSDIESPNRASSVKSDNYHLGLYGGTQWDALGLRTGVAYSWHDMDTRRSVALPGLSGTPQASYNAGTFQAFAELGYGIDAGALRIEPFANVAHVHLHTDRYNESGGATGLSGSSQNTDVTITTLGLHVEHAFDIRTTAAALRSTLGWRHAFGDTSPKARHGFSAGDAFTVAGVPIAKDSAVIDVGINLNLSPNSTFGLSYAAQLSGSAQDHGPKANLSIRF